MAGKLNGYGGERYEVRATDGYGRDILVGYTNRAEASDLVRQVNNHPVWHSPRVIEREMSNTHSTKERT